jgi:hypothetical protein
MGRRDLADGGRQQKRSEQTDKQGYRLPKLGPLHAAQPMHRHTRVPRDRIDTEALGLAGEASYG